MAIFETTFFSASLARFTDLTVIIPSDTPAMFTANNPNYQRPTKTMLLLHGYSGHKSDWLLDGRARELSNAYNLAIILASAENRFYLNLPGTGAKYTEYFGKELPSFVQRSFNLRSAKEDTLIGGYSMGGFGSLHVALSYPETFGGAVALSSALITKQVATMTPSDGVNKNVMADYDYYATTFGDPATVLTSDANPEYQMEKLLASGTVLPMLYLACGSEDFLIESNREFVKFLEEKKVPHVYEEGPGIHNWEFWNKYIKSGIEYLLKD